MNNLGCRAYPKEENLEHQDESMDIIIDLELIYDLIGSDELRITKIVMNSIKVNLQDP